METITVCAWCFPGLSIVAGCRVSHSICPFHLWLEVFKFELENFYETKAIVRSLSVVGG